ncbi:Panacea domain-containing protein [Mesorhizobium sp. M0239]|uniref:Panacea domain-containing protein n=1 Tax=Mesorhizobium sp. M0239 TaxID=2956924 RepID=UPI003336045B
MAQLHDVMAYLLQHYPANMAHELSNARLTKMVYLADWHQALTYGRQMTDIEWYFDNFGPFVRDVEQRAADMEELFVVDLGSNMYGQAKKTFSVRDRNYVPHLTGDEQNSCDHIIEVTRSLYWAPFIKLVYSTHPIASSERYTFLDLVRKAAEYREQQVAVAG